MCVCVIQDSRKHYEMQVHSQAMAVERQRWRGGSSQVGVHFLFLHPGGQCSTANERIPAEHAHTQYVFYICPVRIIMSIWSS